MKTKHFGRLLLQSLAVSAWALAAASAVAEQTTQTATGVVFHDQNNNRKYDQGEKLLEGIRVSNGRQIVKTDAQGRYQLPVDDDTTLFVIKPKGWRTPFNSDMLPQFYYNHKPAGSPPSKYPGLAATGPLPASVDFALYPQEEPEKFKLIIFTDPQPRAIEEVNYIQHDIIEPLIGTTDAALGVTLGDVASNHLETLEPLNHGVGKIGIPWYNVIGNHDANQDSPTDKDSDETWHRIYGPNYYSFDYGSVHFVAMDDIKAKQPDERDKRRHIARVDDEQMEFLKNDLALVPQDQMLVLMMHIPINWIENRQDIYRLIEQRPHCVSLSGHTHTQEHRFIGKEDGWRGAEAHHHIVNVHACGSWWCGQPDEVGIPQATSRDGTPNGYSVLTLEPGKYDWESFAARRRPDYQMNIFTPEVMSADNTSTEVLVNVFGGSERSTVEMKAGDNAQWVKMEKVMRKDPYYEKFLAAEKTDPVVPPYFGMPPAQESTHLWRAMLPANLPKGTQAITVKTRDMFGKTYQSTRLVRVE